MLSVRIPSQQQAELGWEWGQKLTHIFDSMTESATLIASFKSQFYFFKGHQSSNVATLALLKTTVTE